jgi:hypothetical protein
MTHAFVNELKSFGAYSPASEKRISAHIEHVGVGMFATARGDWVIRGTIFGNSNKLCSVESRFRFTPGWDGAYASENTARAFPSAVRRFVEEVLRHPEFGRFVHGETPLLQSGTTEEHETKGN